MKIYNKCLNYKDIVSCKNKSVLTSLAGCFYLLVLADSFFIWNEYEVLIVTLAAFFIVLLSAKFRIYNEIHFTKNNRYFFALSFIYLFYLVLTTMQNIYGGIFKCILYFPMLLMLLWPKDALYGVYKYFYKVIVFISCGSAIVSILSAVDLLQYLPYFELPAREALHERQGITYYVYGCFVTNHQTITPLILRACGMVQEPGHFSIILGFIYIIERSVKHTPNIFIILCGILTFSMNFILMMFLIEFVNALRYRKLFKFLRNILGIIICCVLLYSILPKDYQETINYLFFDRNLSQVLDALKETSSLSGALDERINSTGEFLYKKFLHSGNLLFGDKITDDSFMLSDYRGLILSMGVVGLILCIFMILGSTKHLPFMIRLVFVGALVLVMLHRAWMLKTPFLYLITFLGGMVYQLNALSCSNEHLKNEVIDMSFSKK